MTHTRGLAQAARAAVALAVATLLAACGGGGGGSRENTASSSAPLSCSVADQKDWLGAYMDDWYFWYRLSPRPSASLYADVESYFRALLYTGTDAAFPADRWSRSESTDGFNLFFGDGATMGYGISVAGLELAGDASKPLVVRYVEPLHLPPRKACSAAMNCAASTAEVLPA